MNKRLNPVKESNLEIVSQYLTWCKKEKNFSDQTISTYWTALNIFCKYLKEQSVIICDVDKNIVRGFLEYLHDQKIKEISQNDYRTCVQSFYNYLVNLELVSKNHFVGMKRKKEGKPKRDVLSVSELIRLIEKVNDIGSFLFRDTIMFELFWNSGLRTAELSALEVSHMEYKQIVLEEGEPPIWIYEIKVVNGKGGKDRYVAVGETTTYLIRKYLIGRNLQFPVSDFMFPNNHGNQVNPRQVYEIIKGFLDLSHTKKKGAHVLRHTYATLMLNQGINILAVKKLLGHSSVKTTTIYAKPSKELMANEFNKAHPKGDKDAVVTEKTVIPTIKNFVYERPK